MFQDNTRVLGVNDLPAVLVEPENLLFLLAANFHFCVLFQLTVPSDGLPRQTSPWAPELQGSTGLDSQRIPPFVGERTSGNLMVRSIQGILPFASRNYIGCQCV